MCNRIDNFVISSVVSKLLGTKCRFNAVRPITIYGYKYIKAGNVNAGPNLRIEFIDKSENQLFSPLLSIGDNVLITDHSHGATDLSTLMYIHPKERKLFSKGPVIIEDDVWIGENVCILPNVVIGKGAVIGCNTVVNKNIPPYSIVVGNPMRIINAKK